MLSVDNMLKMVRQSYQTADKHVDERIKNFKTSCSKGCSACCTSQLAIITFLEALVIADFLRRNRTPDELQVICEKLRVVSQKLQSRRPTPEGKGSCPFLSSDEAGFCTIYSSRPLTCRMHYVVSDPVLCRPDAAYQSEIVDVRDLHVDVMRSFVPNLKKQKRLLIPGPMEPLVLHAIEVIAKPDMSPNFKDLEYWRHQAAVIIDFDRRQMKRFGLKDKYVPVSGRVDE